jgi:hypothetical protein
MGLILRDGSRLKSASIRKIIHIVVILLLSQLCISPVQAQVKFYTQLSELNVSPKHTFQVQYIIEGSKDIGHFALPVFEDFRVEYEFDIPNTPTINQQTQQLKDTYAKVVILSPKRTGRFTIPGATAHIDGKSMKSNTATIMVQQTGLASLPRLGEIDTQEESELREGEDIEAKIKKNFFLRVEVSKTSCFVGEPIMVVYKAYSRLQASSSVVKRPSLTGFSVLEMVDAYDGKPDVELLNGTPYYTNIIRKVQLYPLQEGDFSLDAAEIESTIHFVKVNRPLNEDKDGLRKMLNNSNEDKTGKKARTALDYRTTLRSEPMMINVKSLPADNQPLHFAGAVGRFSLAVQTPQLPIREGDLVKIKLVVTGSGNISLLTAPAIEWPDGVDTADPVVKETINKYVYPASGTKTFEYSFAAPDTGNFVIPEVRLPYYDPVQKIYKIATSAPVTLHVKPGVKTDLGSIPANEEISSSSGSRHLYFFGGVVLIVVGWLTWQVLHMRKGRAAKTPGASTTAETNVAKKSIVEETLFKAEWALERGKPQLFYHELEQAIWQVIAIKYNLLPSALNKYNAVQHLRNKNVAPDVISDFSAVLDELEWALYTPDQSAHDMEKLLQKSRAILENIEKE